MLLGGSSNFKQRKHDLECEQAKQKEKDRHAQTAC